jgi:hypothetical protein
MSNVALCTCQMVAIFKSMNPDKIMQEHKRKSSKRAGQLEMGDAP